MIRTARRWLVWRCLDERKQPPAWLAGEDADRRRRLEQILAEGAAERTKSVPVGAVSWPGLDEPPPVADAPTGLSFPWRSQLAAACLAVLVAAAAAVGLVRSGADAPAATPPMMAAASVLELEGPPVPGVGDRALSLVSSAVAGDSPLAREARSIVSDAGLVLQRFQHRIPRRPRPRDRIE